MKSGQLFVLRSNRKLPSVKDVTVSRQGSWMKLNNLPAQPWTDIVKHIKRDGKIILGFWKEAKVHVWNLNEHYMKKRDQYRGNTGIEWFVICMAERLLCVCMGQTTRGVYDPECLSLSRISLIKFLLHWESILLEELQNYIWNVGMSPSSVFAFALATAFLGKLEFGCNHGLLLCLMITWSVRMGRDSAYFLWPFSFPFGLLKHVEFQSWMQVIRVCVYSCSSEVVLRSLFSSWFSHGEIHSSVALLW